MEKRKDDIDAKEWKAALEDVRSSYSDSAKKLFRIAKSVDAPRLFFAVFANIGFGPAERMRELTHGDVPVKMELLAYHLGKLVRTHLSLRECISQD